MKMETTARTRRALALAGTAALLATASACSSSGSSGASAGSSPGGSSAAITLTAMDYFTSEPAHSAVGDILNSCAASAGVKIVHESVANPQLMPKVLQELSSHTLPDLLMLDNPNLQQIAQTGALTPLDTAGVNLDGYYPSILAAGSYQGKVYGLAPGVNSIALIYNKSMLAAAGISSPPATWAELTADASKLTTSQHEGFALSADNDGEGAWQYLPFFWSNGADFTSLDSAAAVQSLQLLTGMVSDGSMSKSVVNWAQSDVNDQFIAGKVAMMVNGPWQFPLLNAATSLHYGVAPIPVPAAGDTLKVPLGGEVWTVPVTSTATEQAAGKVLACMNSSANQLSYAKQVGYVPSLESAATQLAASDPSMGPFVTEVATALSRTAEVGTKYPAIATAIETAEQSALTGASSAQKALATAQTTATSGS
jgi:multiple sugar transport system substrate-binding protein